MSRHGAQAAEPPRHGPRLTARLELRRPSARHAREIFARYASDPEVATYLGWPRHHGLEDTRAFLALVRSEWARTGTGPLLAFRRGDGALLGSTGLAIASADPTRAATGYVLARDAWGQGYASEMLAAMIVLARELGVRTLEARVHVEHVASARVLLGQGFARTAREAHVFPNLPPLASRLADVFTLRLDR